MKFLNPSDGLLSQFIKKNTRRVLIVFQHGVGDVVMFRPALVALKTKYSDVKFDVGLSAGLDQDKIIRDAVILDGDWRNNVKGYDFIYTCDFPMEDVNGNLTKSEICCIHELGIDPVSGIVPIKPKPLVACHFHTTSVPGLAGVDEIVAKMVWDDILSAGCVPIECHFEHVFHNPVNKKFDFVDFHVRNCSPKLESLISLLGSCKAFVGCVSGNFHLALSILSPSRVFLLEKEIKVRHLTKMPVASADVRQYRREVGTWAKALFGPTLV